MRNIIEYYSTILCLAACRSSLRSPRVKSNLVAVSPLPSVESWKILHLCARRTLRHPLLSLVSLPSSSILRNSSISSRPALNCEYRLLLARCCLARCCAHVSSAEVVTSLDLSAAALFITDFSDRRAALRRWCTCEIDCRTETPCRTVRGSKRSFSFLRVPTVPIFV